jgi:hypothetical protein
MVDSVTRTSSSAQLFSAYTASTSGRTLVWGKQFSNGLSGGNSVTFTPYRHDNWRSFIRHGSEVTTRIDGVEYEINNQQFEFLKFDVIVDAAGLDYGVAHIGAKGDALAYADTPSNNASSLANANSQALGILAQKSYKAQHELQGLTVIGELRETLGMIRHPGQAIYRGVGQYLGGLKKVVKGTVPRSRKRMDLVADSWLEYSFGWKPLINDIKNGMKALAEYQVATKQNRRTVHAKGTDSAGDNNPIERSDRYGPVDIKYRVRQHSQSTVKYTASVMVKTPDQAGGFMQNFGLDWPSFVPTIWELIPYSFLVDYFTNIGDIVQAQSNPTATCNWVVKGTEQRSTCSVDVDKCIITESGNPYASRSTLAWKPATGASVVKRYVTRDSYQGSLVPDLQFTIPGMSLKWLNLGALAVTHRQAIRDVSEWRPNISYKDLGSKF